MESLNNTKGKQIEKPTPKILFFVNNTNLVSATSDTQLVYDTSPTAPYKLQYWSESYDVVSNSLTCKFPYQLNIFKTSTELTHSIVPPRQQP